MLQSLKPLTTTKTTPPAGTRVGNAKVGGHIESFDAELTRLNTLIQEFKELMSQADRAALKNHGQVQLSVGSPRRRPQRGRHPERRRRPRVSSCQDRAVKALTL